MQPLFRRRTTHFIDYLASRILIAALNSNSPLYSIFILQYDYTDYTDILRFSQFTPSVLNLDR